MTCEDVELELSGETPSADARAHLEGCVSCQQTARVLGLASLPPVSEAERVALRGLERSTAQAWRAQHRKGETVKRAGSLLLAAGLGALLASGLMWKAQPAPKQITVVEPFVETVFVSNDEENNLSDDEVFFEVGWPSPTEGEL